MPKIKLSNGIHLYYEEYGSAEQTIVFVAGFSAEHLVWEPVAQICAKQYRVIIFDNRGIGRSDCTQEVFTADLLADDTRLLCEELKINEAFFVGSSMGGQIVMALAHQFPALVKSMVISNSVMKLGTFSIGYQNYLDVALNFIRYEEQFTFTDVHELFVKSTVPWVFSNSFLEKQGDLSLLINARKNNEYRIKETGFINQRNVGLTYDATNWLCKIECTCLVIASASDTIFPATEVEKISQFIPKAEYFFFQGDVGHLPFVEQPEDFTNLILNFFSNQ